MCNNRSDDEDDENSSQLPHDDDDDDNDKPSESGKKRSGRKGKASKGGKGSKESREKTVKKRIRHQRAKKPKDMPRRPLSAYNIFFREERGRLLSQLKQSSKRLKSGEGGESKIGFEDLAKTIAKRWKELTEAEMERYKSLAGEDTERYRNEMEEYQAAMVRRSRIEREASELERERQSVARMSASPAGAALGSGGSGGGCSPVTEADADRKPAARATNVTLGGSAPTNDASIGGYMPDLSGLQGGVGAMGSMGGMGGMGGMANLSPASSWPNPTLQQLSSINSATLSAFAAIQQLAQQNTRSSAYGQLGGMNNPVGWSGMNMGGLNPASLSQLSSNMGQPQGYMGQMGLGQQESIASVMERERLMQEQIRRFLAQLRGLPSTDNNNRADGEDGNDGNDREGEGEGEGDSAGR
jgi:HMG-box domain